MGDSACSADDQHCSSLLFKYVAAKGLSASDGTLKPSKHNASFLAQSISSIWYNLRIDIAVITLGLQGS